MLTQKGKIKAVAQQETGPNATKDDGIMDMLISNGMDSHNETDKRAVTVLSNEVDPEPDSSVNRVESNLILQTFKKPIKRQYEAISSDLSCLNSVDIEDSSKFTDILQESLEKRSKIKIETNLDSNSNFNNDVCKTFVNSIKPVGNITTEPIETSIIQNVSKLTKNFTLNVNSNVSSNPTVQDVQNASSGNQTLWLPTIMRNNEDNIYEDEVDMPPTTLSQFIFTGSGQHFSSHINNSVISSPKSSNSKFQILSSITIPKPTTLNNALQPSVSTCSKVHTSYLNQNNTSSSFKQTTAGVPSVLAKIPSVNVPISTGRVNNNQSQVKCTPIINSSSIQMKGTSSVGRQKNMVNSNYNKTDIPPVVPTQTNIFSRVIPNQKISLQTAGKVMKSTNVQYNSKTGSSDPSQSPNLIHTHKVQSAMPVKIIQQAFPSSHKTGLKPIQTSKIATSGSKNITYTSINTLSGKTWPHTSTPNMNQNNVKNSTYAKNISGIFNVQKVSKSTSQKMLHQSSNALLTSNSSQLNRGSSHQPYESGNNSKYVQNYVGLDSMSSTSNQDLTAQILQSLSQSRHAVSSVQSISSNKRINLPIQQTINEAFSLKKINEQIRQVHGDPNTVCSSDDMLGIEDRPQLPNDTLPFHYHSLQLVMLDHTYAVSTQTISNNAINGTNVTGSTSPIINSIVISTENLCSTKSANSPPTVTSCQTAVSMPVVIQSSLNNVQNSNFQYNVVSGEDDDAASIVSSIEDDRNVEKVIERHDSDTETAPEGEEEGKTRCVCEFTHDDGYMICCDRCGEWQHVDCMGIDRQNIPDDYMCDQCEPRIIDRKRARSIQIRKREELTGFGSSGSDSSSGISITTHKKQYPLVSSSGSNKKKPLTITTYSNTISGVSRTVPPLSTYSPSYNIGSTSQVQNKKCAKKSRKMDNTRKCSKRKLPEKRKRKCSESPNYRSKCYPVISSHQLNQWTNTYELAMTNHYSPELRAKIARYCSNRGGNTTGNMADILTVHLCTTVPHAGSKILIATKDIKENSPIIELRGKYMLSTQHKPQPQISGRVGSQKPGPFLFFYRLPKDSTQICIDTRTYGNDARFVRRSCKPNAELQHCIIKGVLHVYLITISSIQSNTEITIRHETSGSSQQCACGNPKYCKQNVVSSPISHKNNGAATDNSGDRRGRTRLSSSSSLNAPSSMLIDVKKSSSPEPEMKQLEEPYTDLIKSEDIEQDFVENISSVIKENIFLKNETVIENTDLKMENDVKKEIFDKDPMEDDKNDVKPKENMESIVEIKKDDVCNITNMKKDEDIEDEITSDNIELTQSIKSVTSVVKAKEDKSKRSLNTRRTSVQPIRTTRASASALSHANESSDEKNEMQSDCTQPKEKKKMTREERKMEAIMKAFERLEKAELRRQESKDRQIKRRESDTQQCNVNSNEFKEHNDELEDNSESSSVKRKRRKKGRVRTASQNQLQRNRNRLNSADSDILTSGEESGLLLSPIINNKSSESIPENSTGLVQPVSDTMELRQAVERINVGLSSACLLVEAAVGPLESTFKFPKTKKDMVNEWLNKSPDRNSYDTNHIDYTHMTDNNNTTYMAKKLFSGEKFENLMKAANTMIGNFSGGVVSLESTPEKNVTNEFFGGRGVTNSCDMNSSYSSLESPSQFPITQIQKRFKSSDNIKKEIKDNRRFRKDLKDIIDGEKSMRNATVSNTGTEVICETEVISSGNITPPIDESYVALTQTEMRDTEITIVPQPPQRSAKKRWLRQAISEESDSPTAESPPNEMVTPLKKRRLARESLSVESNFNNCEESAVGNSSKINDVSSNETALPCETIENDLKCNSNNLPHFLQCEEINTNSCSSTEINRFEPCITTDNADNNAHDVEEFTSHDTSKTPKKNELSADFEKKSRECPINNSNNTRDLVIKTNSNEIENIDLKGTVNVDTCTSPFNEVNDSHLTLNSCCLEENENVSPVLDEIDDIKKKIHTFHTENIQILKIRNKKQPKEKRKKVNLNFDLCVLADQTVGVKLKSENEIIQNKINKEESLVDQQEQFDNKQIFEMQSTPVINMVEPTDKYADQSNTISLAFIDHSLPCSSVQLINMIPVNNESDDKKIALRSSDDFKECDASSIQMPNIDIIKNAIDKYTNIENKNIDEYKNVEEILTRVNQMDYHNSLLLSGVLKDSNHSLDSDITSTSCKTSTKSYNTQTDPIEKPKPVKRKLSITEYRRRHSMLSSGSSHEQDVTVDGDNQRVPESSNVNVIASSGVSLGDETTLESCKKVDVSNILQSIDELVNSSEDLPPESIKLMDTSSLSCDTKLFCTDSSNTGSQNVICDDTILQTKTAR